MFILIGLAAVVLLNLVVAWFLLVGGMEIAVDPGVVFTLGGWKITDTMVISSSVVLLLLVVAGAAADFSRCPSSRISLGGLQTVLEMAVQVWGSMSCDTAGSEHRQPADAHMCTVGLYIIAGGLVELFGVRARPRISTSPRR